MSIKINDNGYLEEEPEHSKLIHRQIAYNEIYLKNREDYPLPFSKYVIHHKDENKLNNDVSNLQIVTIEEHNEIHGFTKVSQKPISWGKMIFTIIIVILFGLFMNHMFSLFGL